MRVKTSVNTYIDVGVQTNEVLYKNVHTQTCKANLKHFYIVSKEYCPNILEKKIGKVTLGTVPTIGVHSILLNSKNLDY